MPDGSFPIQARSLAEVEKVRGSETEPAAVPSVQQPQGGSALHSPSADPLAPICAIEGCDNPVSMGKRFGWRRYCCAAHALVGKRLLDNVSRVRRARANGVVPRSYRPIDIDALRRLAADDLTVTQIAEALGHDNSSIGRAAKKHKIAIHRDRLFHRLPGASEACRARADELIRLHETGATYSAIAKQLGITKNAVVGQLDRMGRIGEREAWDPAPRTQFVFPPFGHCVFPAGHMPNMTFCGADVEDITKPYCAAHIRVAYLPPKPADMRLVA